ncbi:hypothetical protein TNCV_2164191 [Trichonephila clavipes]|nr:hypothetical protein TNCV_2164191 [Trichonephila clavipes]
MSQVFIVGFVSWKSTLFDRRLSRKLIFKNGLGDRSRWRARRYSVGNCWRRVLFFFMVDQPLLATDLKRALGAFVELGLRLYMDPNVTMNFLSVVLRGEAIINVVGAIGAPSSLFRWRTDWLLFWISCLGCIIRLVEATLVDRSQVLLKTFLRFEGLFAEITPVLN